MRVARKLLAVAAIGLACTPVALGQTINVPADHGTIQAAIVAAVNGDVVSVAPGTYNERIDLLGKSITVQGISGAGQTTIDGQGGGPVVRTSNAAVFTLRGFTVRGGASSSTFVGGIASAGATNGLIEHMVITGNSACSAPAAELSGTVMFRNNVVWGNTNWCTGGGTIGPITGSSGNEFRDNLIVNNRGASGGGLSVRGTAILTGNVIMGNQGSGGGIHVWEGPVQVVNNLVARNGGSGSGVEIQVDSQSTDQLIANNTVVNAGTSSFGGALGLGVTSVPGSSTVRNNVLSSAGGVPVRCVEAGFSGVITPPTLIGNDFVGAGPPVAGSVCTNPVGTAGNVAVVPGFVGPRDFHLAASSPLIDAGTAAPIPVVDGDGDPRPIDGNPASVGAQIDIGWDEAGDATSIDTTLTGAPPEVIGGAQQPVFTFTTQTAGATFECDVDMGGFLPCTSPLTVPVQSSHTHVFRVRARTAGGLRDRSPAMTIYDVDGTAPDTLVDTVPVAVADGWETRFHSDDPTASFECALDGASFAVCSSPFRFRPKTGAHSLAVRAIDPVGNVDASPLVLPFVVPPPDTFLTQPTPVFFSGKWSVTITSNGAGVTFECSLDAAPFTACASPLELDVSLGSHTLAARARESVDVVDPTPASVTWTSNCTLFGSFGDDLVTGTGGDDRLCGLDGNDAIHGLSGNDILLGAAGDDVLNGGPGVDSLNGGDGIDDVADYSDRATAVKVRLGDGLPDGGVEDGTGDTIGVLVEDIWGGQANDELTGDSNDNVIDGGHGADLIQGGPGFDFADYSTATTPVTADLDGQPGDDGRVGEGDSIGLDIEALLGGSAGDTLTGGAQDDFLAGGAGDDTLAGGAGADFIFGEDGNDRIIASDGVIDEIDCGPGFDTAYTDVGESTTGCETRIFGNPPPPTPVPSPLPIAPPPTPPVAPVHRVRLTGSTGNAKAGVTVRLTCDSNQLGSCRVRLTAKTTVVTNGKKRTLVLGRVTANVAPGAASALRIPLNAQAATLFKTRARLTVKVESALQSRTGQFAAGPVRTVVVRRLNATPRLRAAAIRSLHRMAPQR